MTDAFLGIPPDVRPSHPYPDSQRGAQEGAFHGIETFGNTAAMKDKEERLRNPEPGTKAAAARDFGIDLTLLIERLRLTPEERVRLLDDIRGGLYRLKTQGRFVITNEGH